MHSPLASGVAAQEPALSPTEHRLAESERLDDLAVADVLALLNAHDRKAVDAVGAVLPQIAEVVEEAARRFRRGGDVHYFGAGTSGRLGVLDAAELSPTFNLPAGERVIAHIAGGAEALVTAVEGAEDSWEDGAHEAGALGPDDLVIGLAASGNTPYVGGALEAARSVGAATVLVSSNPHARLIPFADTHILLDTGAEVLTGSTRLKAASAEKMFLNGFSTALMIAVGRTWSNLMVSVVATNEKLRHRTVRILCEAAGIDEEPARELLAQTGGDLKVALVAALTGVPVDDARVGLAANDGVVRAAVTALVG